MTQFRMRSLLLVVLIASVFAVQVVSAQSAVADYEPTGQHVEAFVNLNVREGASTEHPVIGGITSGTSYAVLGEEEGWYIIDFEGQVGYVAGAFVRVKDETAVEPEQPAPEEEAEEVVVPTEPTGQFVEAFVNLNVREGAGTNHPVIGGITSGTSYAVFGQSGDWYIIDFEGQTGYVAGAFVRVSDEATAQPAPEEEAEEVVVPTEPTGQFVEAFVNLNVRQGAGTNHAVIGGISSGTRYAVFGQSGDWYIIDFEGQVGYVSGAFVRVTDDQAEEPADTPEETAPETDVEEQEPLTLLEGVTASSDVIVNVRTGAGTEYRIIGQIQVGESYGVYGEEFDWVMIDYNGQLGYVLGELVNVSGQ